MSNETDLDWLARNVHEWREGANYICVDHTDGGYVFHEHNRNCAVWFTRDQWLARRAELQNKPGWAKHPWPQIFQNEDGHWFGARAGWDFNTHISSGWKGDSVSLLRDDGEYLQSGAILGDWRDTLERRPADLSEPAVTERLEEATQTVLAAVPALMGEKFHFDPEPSPVSVSNESVPLEQPVAVAGTGNGSASESAFLIGRVIDLLRTSVGHFSADELADLNELTGAELTKRDERVCGGQKYIDAHWFERGELPPVGVECIAVTDGIPDANCVIIAISTEQVVVKWTENQMFDVLDMPDWSFRPIRTERDDLVDVLTKAGISSYAHLVADAILAAGYRKESK